MDTDEVNIPAGPEPAESNYMCGTCAQMYDEMNELEDHMETEHVDVNAVMKKQLDDLVIENQILQEKYDVKTKLHRINTHFLEEALQKVDDLKQK